MPTPKDCFEYYDWLKMLFEDHGFRIEPYTKISQGLRFNLYMLGRQSEIRLVQNEEELYVDLSKIDNPTIEKRIESLIINADFKTLLLSHKKRNESPIAINVDKLQDHDPEELIGVSHAGKDDYFGPIVSAAVFCNKEIEKQLLNIDILQAGQLNYHSLSQICAKLKKITPHSLVIMSPSSYNDVYKSIKDQSNLLAWGYAKVIGRVLEQESCPYALSTPYCDGAMIKAALSNADKSISLLQRKNAHQHIGVMAASVLAKEAYLEAIRDISKKFHCDIPSGHEKPALQAAQHLIEEYGKDILKHVAKLNFEITDHLN